MIKANRIIIPVLGMLVLLLCGCNKTAQKDSKEVKAQRIIEDTVFIDKDDDVTIFTDSKTGVEYFYYVDEGKWGNHIAITPRLDRNGKPFINKQYSKIKLEKGDH